MYRILYVDDEPDFLDIGKMFLEKSGDFTVTTALSAQEAIRLLEQEKSDIIISDYQMPDMDGIQFLVEVRSRFGQIPFILFTGRGREEIVIQAINSGADFYIQKGGEPEAQFAELTHKVRQAASRKKAEDLLKESEEKYRHLIEHANEAIVVVQDGMPRLVNQRTVELTGYLEQELLSMSISAVIHSDDRAMVMERYQKRMKGEDVASRYAFRLSSKDAGTRWVEISIVVLDWEGRPATLNFLTDITERKNAEEALRESEELFATAFYSGPLMLAISDIETGIYLNINDTFSRLTGYSRNEAIGKTSIELGCIHPEDRERLLQELKRTGRVAGKEFRFTKKDGESGWYLFFGEIITVSGKKRLLSIAEDITDRKRAENALHESEEKYRVIFNNEIYAICIFDLDTLKLLDVNDAYTQMYGYTRDELLSGMTIHDITAEHEVSDSATEKARNEGTIFIPLRYHRKKNGTIFPVEIVGGPYDWKGKQVMFALFHDITDRKKAEEQLRDLTGTLADSMNLAKMAAWTYDIDSGVFTFNDAFYAMHGMTAEEAGGYQMSARAFAERYTDPAYVLQVSDTIRQALESSDPHFELTAEGILRRSDGTPFWVTTWFKIERDASGRVIRLHGVNQDITGRKRAENALRENEERFRLILDATNDGIWDRDIPTGTAFFSPRWYTMLGYAPGEMPGSYATWQSLIHPEDIGAAEQAVQDHIGLGRGGYYRLEFRMRTKDGNWKWILARGRVVGWDADNKPVRIVGTHTDITDRKQAEEGLSQANKKLTLLSSITRHDINNQLTVLRGYLNFLERQQPGLTRNEYFLKLATAAQRISAMIRFTKEYEEIGVHAPAWQDCRTLADTAAKWIQDGQVMVKNDLPAGAEVFVDPLIARVFYNLMDNAVRYGGKCTTLRFSFTERDGDHIVVCEDDGVGVPAEEKERIFERGFGKNTGLGLYLSREILAITGITIRETGEPGKGARFEMTVPKGMHRQQSPGDPA